MMAYTLMREVGGEWRPATSALRSMKLAKRAGNKIRDGWPNAALAVYAHGIRGLMPCHYRHTDPRYKGPIPEPDHRLPINWTLYAPAHP